MKTTPPYPSCTKCGAVVEAREDQAVARFQGEEILFQRVPLGVCTGCGERFFPARSARLLEQATVLCSAAVPTTAGGLRALRDALKLSREALATKLRVSAQTIFRWETARSRPSRRFLDRLDALRRKAQPGRRAG